jgi:hypothetical protein
MEQAELNPRQKAKLILDWARNHINNPCGQTPEEKAYMKKSHQDAVRGALKEPGIGETLSPDENQELQGLLQNPEEKK